MRSPFKLKSGNKSSFKSMGSSPLTKKKPPVDPATLDSSKLGGFGEAKLMEDRKETDKEAFEHMFNKDAPLKQKDFNFTGDSKSTTPGYSTTKAAKNLVPTKVSNAKPATYGGQTKVESITKQKKARAVKKVSGKMKNQSAKKVAKKAAKILKPGQELTDKLMKAVNKNITPRVKKKIVHKGAVNIAKNVGRKLINLASRRLGPLGVALTAYDIARALPKAAKATSEALVKEAKTGNKIKKPKY